MCEITWETIPPMRGDPVSYVLQVLVGRESEYKQVAAMAVSVCAQVALASFVTFPFSLRSLAAF